MALAPLTSYDGIVSCAPASTTVAWLRFTAPSTETASIAAYAVSPISDPIFSTVTVYPDFNCPVPPPTPIVCATNSQESPFVPFATVAGNTYLIRIQIPVASPSDVQYEAAFYGILATIPATATPTPTATPAPTATLTPSPTATPLPPTDTPTPTVTVTPSPIPPTATPSPTPTSTPIPSPTPLYGPGTYTVDFRAVIREGGSVTETAETSGVGGAVSNIGTNGFLVGDTTSRQQTVAFASFDTSAIPPSATIDSASLSLWALSTKGNPTGLVPLKADVKTGLFGSLAAAEAGDFEEAATAADAASFPATTATAATQPLSAAGRSAINKGGRTQVRLRFQTDDNNNAIADQVELASGNCATPLRRPLLTITFTVPGP